MDWPLVLNKCLEFDTQSMRNLLFISTLHFPSNYTLVLIIVNPAKGLNLQIAFRATSKIFLISCYVWFCSFHKHPE